ncbi:hypothetical protein [Pirellula sp. SH-Sr6A]|uniref:hypothetical protein n=1 Tax=Pirellula sp. SH-Sr6A TaxID=1632865 RepID=UPI0011BA7580|nr:hypothetical protein [Pirellula sp. SH-Sr6A]
MRLAAPLPWSGGELDQRLLAFLTASGAMTAWRLGSVMHMNPTQNRGDNATDHPREAYANDGCNQDGLPVHYAASPHALAMV